MSFRSFLSFPSSVELSSSESLPITCTSNSTVWCSSSSDWKTKSQLCII
jgi:hypothetical protein